MNWIKILIVCFLPILYKIVNNLWHWKKLASYQRAYIESLNVSLKMNAIEGYVLSDEERSILDKIQESKSKIIDLFKKAGLESFSATAIKEVGYGRLTPVKVDIFENLEMALIAGDTNIPAIILKNFTRGIGVYKERAKEALNPLWWINLLIFLPEKLVSSYLGISIENNNVGVIVKTFNILYWLIDVIIVALVFFHYGYATIGHFNLAIR
jgi:hypothetical protein